MKKIPNSCEFRVFGGSGWIHAPREVRLLRKPSHYMSPVFLHAANRHGMDNLVRIHGKFLEIKKQRNPKGRHFVRKLSPLGFVINHNGGREVLTFLPPLF